MRAVDGTQRLGALGVPELEQRAAAGEQAARAMVIERVDHVLQSTRPHTRMLSHCSTRTESRAHVRGLAWRALHTIVSCGSALSQLLSCDAPAPLRSDHRLMLWSSPHCTQTRMYTIIYEHQTRSYSIRQDATVDYYNTFQYTSIFLLHSGYNA